MTDGRDRAALRLALQNPDAAIRARAIDALATLRDLESAPLLRWSLRSDKDTHVREEAAVALGRLRDASAADDLIGALGHDDSEHVREEAAIALGRLGEPRTIPALLEAMNDRYKMVHRAAAEALEAMGPEAMGRLVEFAEGPRSPAGDAASAALQALRSLDRRADLDEQDR